MFGLLVGVVVGNGFGLGVEMVSLLGCDVLVAEFPLLKDSVRGGEATFAVFEPFFEPRADFNEVRRGMADE